MSYDAGSIASTLDVDLRPFHRGLEQAKRDGREFQRQKISPVVDLDDRRARDKILSIDAQLRRVAGAKATATVAVEHGQALRKLIDTSDRLDRLGKEVATARADVDTDSARRRLAALDIQLRRIGLITSRPKVTVDGVERANLQLDALALRLKAAGDAGSGGGGGSAGGSGGGWLSRFAKSKGPNPGWMGLGVGAALPLVAPAAGLAVGAGASLLTPAVAGLIGLGGFGLAAKSSYTTVQTDVTKLNKLVAQYNAATTNKQRAAALAKEQLLWKSLDPAQRQAVRNVQGLDAAWKSFQKRLEPQTFGALAGGAKVANTGLGLLLPSSRAAGTSVIGLERSTNRKLQSPFSQYVSQNFLPGETQRAISSGGTALQNTVAGLGHLMVGFAPLGADFEHWLVRVSGRFEKWSEGGGPSKFVSWVEKEGPPAAKALAGLAHGLEGVAVGLGPIARVELAALTPALNFIGDLGKQNPEVLTALGVGLLGVAGGLKAVALAKGAAGGASVIGRVIGRVTGLGGRGGGGGGIGGVLGGRGGPGGSPLNPLFVAVVDQAPGAHLPGGKTAKKVLDDIKNAGSKVAQYGPSAWASRGLLKAGGLGRAVLRGAAAGLDVAALADPVVLASMFAGSDTNKGAQQVDPVIRSLLKRFTVKNGSVYAPGGGLVVGDAARAVLYGTQPQTSGKVLSNPNFLVHTRSGDLLPDKKPGVREVQLLAQALKDAAAAARPARNAILGLAPAEAAAARATATHTEKIQQQWRTLGLAPHYVGLAEATAAAGGRRIGTAISVGMSQGIDRGFKTHVLRAVTTMADGSIKVVSTKFQLGSPSKLMRQYGLWSGQGLGLGFLDSIPGIQAAFAKGAAAGIKAVRAGLASRLASAQQQRAADRSARSQFTSNLAGQYVSGLNLTGAIGPAGNVGNLSAYIGNYAGSLRTLGIDVKKLRGKHLSPGLLDVIAQAGPVQGAALAQSILSGHSGSINTLNRNFAAVGTYANRAAGQDAAAQFAATLAKDDQMIRLLNELVQLAKKNPQALAAAFDTTVRGAKTHGR